jgi:hypothetical protein
VDSLGEALIAADTGGAGSGFVGDRIMAAHPAIKTGIRTNKRFGKIDLCIFPALDFSGALNCHNKWFYLK